MEGSKYNFLFKSVRKYDITIWILVMSFYLTGLHLVYRVRNQSLTSPPFFYFSNSGGLLGKVFGSGWFGTSKPAKETPTPANNSSRRGSAPCKHFSSWLPVKPLLNPNLLGLDHPITNWLTTPLFEGAVRFSKSYFGM